MKDVCPLCTNMGDARNVASNQTQKRVYPLVGPIQPITKGCEN